MLRFFRKDYATQIAVIMLMIVTVWLPAFINAPRQLICHDSVAPLFKILADTLNFSPRILTTIAFLAFSFSVFFLNSMLTANQLSTRNSTIGSLTAIICLSSTTITQDYYPFLTSCPLILAAMQTLYALFLTEKPESYLFNIGIFLSFASLLYLPSTVLILWVMLTMMIFGYRQIRLYIIPILGFVTPYFIMLTICYFTRNLNELLSLYSTGYVGLELHEITLGLRDTMTLAVECVLFLLSVMVLKSSKKDNSIQMRKRVGLTYLLFVFSLLLMTLQEPIMCNGLIFMVLSVFYAMALSSLKKSLVADILMTLMIIGAFAIQYLPLFT